MIRHPLVHVHRESVRSHIDKLWQLCLQSKGGGSGEEDSDSDLQVKKRKELVFNLFPLFRARYFKRYDQARCQGQGHNKPLQHAHVCCFRGSLLAEKGKIRMCIVFFSRHSPLVLASPLASPLLLCKSHVIIILIMPNPDRP